MSAILEEVYSGTDAGVAIIKTLEIRTDEPIFVCNGFEEVEAKLENDTEVVFEAGNLAISRPEKSDSTDQTLSFAIWNAQERAHKAVSDALEAGKETKVVYREYLEDNLDTPAYGPLEFTMTGGEFEGMICTIQASYFDALNTQYPRERYTNLNAPALQYMT